jgi:hypothetical protein
MRTRFIPLALTAVLLLSLGAVVAACGGSDEDGNGGNGGNGGTLTLEEYFNKVADLQADNDKKSDEVQAKLQEDLDAAESPQEAIDVFGNLIDELATVVRESHDALDELQAPSEVQDLHKQLVAVFSVAAGSLDDFAAEFDEGIELTDLEDFGNRVETEFSSLGNQVEVVCVQLQDVADENNIDVDLACGQDGG